ncbi:protein kinase domain-containing protein [Verticillium alfalfae VaMs.102]|uniref:Protein kinase domain-containing protein n=1 Tax=Verticillium alfalfae (strain VaMs.102 / ATCC MYA-4576 / FGSC 10136) TaxID=526221 RepID=C9SBM4_VERA1|nr:protein kinase domain-containing protein [Verticillium alfalfae VaMs.102]EEY15758.1 protein kinase domain-containing protein [Verticillium alfalfae VaMs.102]
MPLVDGILTPQDEITAQQVHLQGLLPSEWRDRWDQRAKWFDQTGRPLSNDCDIWPWDRRFEQWIQEPRESCSMEVVTDEEQVARFEFEMLKRMLAWRPGERPSVEGVLRMPWMTKWALPAYEESLGSLAKDL